MAEKKLKRKYFDQVQDDTTNVFRPTLETDPRLDSQWEKLKESGQKIGLNYRELEE